MEVPLDSEKSTSLHQLALAILLVVGVLIAVVGIGMYASYPGPVPPWAPWLLTVVIFGAFACCCIAIMSLFVSPNKARVFGILLLALVILAVAGFLRNGDRVRSVPAAGPHEVTR
jgi:ABC-type transport system involved in multi-copper enzyme maturation permease subunit